MKRSFVMVMLLIMGIRTGPVLGDEASPSPGRHILKAGSSRIIGGEEAESGEWPWMVALVKASATSNVDGQFCGASLVGAGWVLTAAHCMEGVSPEEIQVVVGVHDLAKDTGRRIDVKQIISHPDYDPDTMDMDIALLELSESAPASYRPLPIYEKRVDEGTIATVIGWGNMSAVGSEFPEKLQEVSVPVVSNAVCNEGYNQSPKYDNAITDNMICAGLGEGGKDSCQGDSGGPVVIDDNGVFRLAGIVSWGEGCAQPGFYGVYTRISNFAEVLKTVLGASTTPSAVEPAAKEESAATPVNTPVTIDVLANDKGTGEGPLSIDRIFDPAHGTALIDGNNRVVYTPESGFTGTDSFRYMLREGTRTAEASVTVTVGGQPGVYRSEGSPIAIADDDPEGIESTITVAPQGVVSDVKVTLNITHPWNEDLRILLISPAGTRVGLFDPMGYPDDGMMDALDDEAEWNDDTSGNFINTVLEDGAEAGNILMGSAPYTGSFKPLEPLGILKGEPVAGEWKLLVIDDAERDRGTLDSWRLEIDTAE